MMEASAIAAVCSIDSERFETALKESISKVLETFDGVEKFNKRGPNNRCT